MYRVYIIFVFHTKVVPLLLNFQVETYLVLYFRLLNDASYVIMINDMLI